MRGKVTIGDLVHCLLGTIRWRNPRWRRRRVNDQRRDLRQVSLSDEGRSALKERLERRFPGFPDEVKTYRWKEVTQVDLRTVKRMLTPGETVRRASVVTVFANLDIPFDQSAHLAATIAAAPPDVSEEPAPAFQQPGVADSAAPGPLVDLSPGEKAPETLRRSRGKPGLAAMALGAIALVAIVGGALLYATHRRPQAGPSPTALEIQRHAPQRWMIAYDDFTRDSVLDSAQWSVAGPALSNSLARLDTPPDAIVAPRIGFDPDAGLAMTSPSGNMQQTGIESVQSFSAPFTVTVEAMAVQTHASSMEVAIADPAGKSGIAVIGSQGAGEQDTGFLYAAPAGAGHWAVQGRLSPMAPDDQLWYTLAIRVAASGAATVAVSSGGHIVGQASRAVGKGPFRVVLGQGASQQQPPGPNQVYWLAFQAIHG